MIINTLFSLRIKEKWKRILSLKRINKINSQLSNHLKNNRIIKFLSASNKKLYRFFHSIKKEMLQKFRNSWFFLKNCKKSTKTKRFKEKRKLNRYLEFSRAKFMKDFQYKVSKKSLNLQKVNFNTISITSNKKMKTAKLRNH